MLQFMPGRDYTISMPQVARRRNMDHVRIPESEYTWAPGTLPDSSLSREDVKMALDADQAAYDEFLLRSRYDAGEREISSGLGDGFQDGEERAQQLYDARYSHEDQETREWVRRNRKLIDSQTVYPLEVAQW